jgi:hypothetical protein
MATNQKKQSAPAVTRAPRSLGEGLRTSKAHYNNISGKRDGPAEKERAALAWLKRDFHLLPVQPNSKRLVKGFGYYRSRVTTPEKVYQWFGEKTLSNLAVCATQTSLILDFDDPDLYTFWAVKFPNAARTYTERTPRGGYHVFAHVWGCDLKGLSPIKGVEFKRVALVYPSTIDGRQYTQGTGDLLKLDARRVLSPISEPIMITTSPRAEPRGKGILPQLKAAYSCLDLVRSVNSDLKVYGSGKRFITVNCPFHDDKEPSFWIDTERNLWGCHACGVRGDVINLYARLKGLTVPQAIREMRGNL